MLEKEKEGIIVQRIVRGRSGGGGVADEIASLIGSRERQFIFACEWLLFAPKGDRIANHFQAS